MTNQQIAEELLRIISNSEHHNTAWLLKETLEKLRELISGTNAIDFYDEQGMMYNYGWDDCLKEIDGIIDELELL